ncbi:hypothetical protein FA13DRAFT_1779174 [Coprinellus micaceus]|uniref:Uncharacterized protein n=1 Tax=Coprinellus micaceus TaxID=71717 RepID=A0A4Y7SIL6_COPMI|nr:hypothetical protein FA13DRAFT_1779174 [Coprinellus micaceus]
MSAITDCAEGLLVIPVHDSKCAADAPRQVTVLHLVKNKIGMISISKSASTPVQIMTVSQKYDNLTMIPIFDFTAPAKGNIDISSYDHHPFGLNTYWRRRTTMPGSFPQDHLRSRLESLTSKYSSRKSTGFTFGRSDFPGHLSSEASSSPLSEERDEDQHVTALSCQVNGGNNVFTSVPSKLSKNSFVLKAVQPTVLTMFSNTHFLLSKSDEVMMAPRFWIVEKSSCVVLHTMTMTYKAFPLGMVSRTGKITAVGVHLSIVCFESYQTHIPWLNWVAKSTSQALSVSWVLISNVHDCVLGLPPHEKHSTGQGHASSKQRKRIYMSCTVLTKSSSLRYFFAEEYVQHSGEVIVLAFKMAPRYPITPPILSRARQGDVDAIERLKLPIMDTPSKASPEVIDIVFQNLALRSVPSKSDLTQNFQEVTIAATAPLPDVDTSIVPGSITHLAPDAIPRCSARVTPHTNLTSERARVGPLWGTPLALSLSLFWNVVIVEESSMSTAKAAVFHHLVESGDLFMGWVHFCL